MPKQIKYILVTILIIILCWEIRFYWYFFKPDWGNMLMILFYGTVVTFPIAIATLIFFFTSKNFSPLLGMISIFMMILTIFLVLGISSILHLKKFHNQYRCFEGWMEYYPGKPDPFEDNIQLGDTFTKQKNFTQAIINYTRAIDINPNNAVAYYLRGDSYAQQDNFFQATIDYTKSIFLYMANYNQYPIGACAAN